jgi:hypothetical protein
MGSFRRRPASRADAAAVAELVGALDVGVLGSTEDSLDELEDEWRDFGVEHDAWLVEDGGRVVGHGTVELARGFGQEAAARGVALYERAGMRVHWAAVVFERDL